MHPRLRPLALFFLFLPVLSASQAIAHLCLIRQGLESGGQPELNNHFGTALAVGDFNGDGFQDLATGAPDDGQGDPMPGLDGALTVNYGSPWGLTHEGAQYITIGDVPDIVVRFGRSLAVGNFNNDAYDDLAVGAPDVDKLSVGEAGGVLIYMGGPLGLPNTASVTFDQEDIGQVSQTDDRWGWALSSGDFNGDGYADLGVGAIGEIGGQGAVSAIYGSAGGLTAAGAQTLTLFDIGGGGGGASSFGWALTSGNVTGTSHDDLIASAVLEETMATQGGKVYTIPGSGSGLDGNNTIVIDGTVSGEPNSNIGPNEFGYSLAVGEFPHGSPDYAELVIGEPGWDEDGMESTGRVLVGSVDPSAAESSWVVLTKESAGGSSPIMEDRYGTAVATGKYRAGTYDYVAVSSPGDDLTLFGEAVDDVGQIYLYASESAGLGKGLRSVFHAVRLNDKELEFNSQIGQCLAFGFFDDSGRANLAVGAPDKNYDVWVEDQGGGIINAGQVYIIAPWRQIQWLKSRTAIALNCEGEIIFSQRPFHRAPIASVTKTMTGLLACEAVAMGFDSSLVHSAPEWLKMANLPCNCWPFVEGQETNFMDLVRISMGKSSNDATYAVADMLTGPLEWTGIDSTARLFVDDMNTRAGLLGMNRTIYSNPAGYDFPHYSLEILPYSTAYDQALLAQAAMQNTCLREMVATSGWTVRTFYPSGTFLNFNIDVTVDQILTNGFKTNFDDNHPDAVGIKGGKTAPALFTAQYSVLNASGGGNGHVVGAAFGFDVAADRYSDGARLMNLALARCADGDSIPLPPSPPEDDPVGVFADISTCDTVITRISADLTEAAYNPATLTVVPGTVTTYPVDLSLRMFRETVFEVGSGEIVGVSLDRRRSSQGWRITNFSNETAELQILFGTPVDVNLSPGESWSTPGSASVLETSDSFFLQNVSMGTTNTIQLEMINQWLPLGMVDAGDQQNIAFGRVGDPTSDELRIYILGMDSECTNTVNASINAGFPSTTDIDPTNLPPPGELSGSLLGNYPNPSLGGSTVRYELTRPSAIRLEIFDLAGRRVRTLVSLSQREAGMYAEAWDGRNTAGIRVPAGVYFVQLVIDESRYSRRLVLLR